MLLLEGACPSPIAAVGPDPERNITDSTIYVNIKRWVHVTLERCPAQITYFEASL